MFRGLRVFSSTRQIALNVAVTTFKRFNDVEEKTRTARRVMAKIPGYYVEGLTRRHRYELRPSPCTPGIFAYNEIHKLFNPTSPYKEKLDFLKK